MPGTAQHNEESEEPYGLDLDAFAQVLDAEQVRVEARLATMSDTLESVFAASMDSNADDEHDPEGQTIAYERSQLAASIRAAEAHLHEVGDALDRLRRGTYGSYEVCHDPIPVERLRARPTARTCVRHATA